MPTAHGHQVLTMAPDSPRMENKMIQQNLKKKYKEWVQVPDNTDLADFILAMAEEHNTTPEILGKILENSIWLPK